ncbi:MAG: hydroxymethylpyrimidine/phosphomethylpyrimidine kinase [Bacteroidia bacterium]|nr:hydroxymethylpyrimidine/phosphomethylpyrimidine kinase [Bacteroidia bacterium]
MQAGGLIQDPKLPLGHHSYERPTVLSIAAWDPCGGAGLAADIKTFEQHKVLGMGVITAITAQTENEFFLFKELDLQTILEQLRPLLRTYRPRFFKIGMCPHAYIETLADEIHHHIDDPKIVWDPVMFTSTGFNLPRIEKEEYIRSLKKIYLFMPNLPEWEEFKKIVRIEVSELSNEVNILVKGGHHQQEKGCDKLYAAGRLAFSFNPKVISSFDKRGTGCVLSSAIVSRLALGDELIQAVQHAKVYMEKILNSNSGKLSYHVA